MQPYRIYTLLFIILLPCFGRAAGDSLSIFAMEYPTKGADKKLYQRLFYQIPTTGNFNIKILCNKIFNTDTLGIYDLDFEDRKIKDSVGFIDLYYGTAKSTHKLNSDFCEIVSRFGTIPVGKYFTTITFKNVKDSNFQFSQIIFDDIDSNLSITSGLREKVNAAVITPQKAKEKLQVKMLAAKKNKQTSNTAPTKDQLNTSSAQMKRKLRSIKGLDIRTEVIGKTTFSTFYYKQFFLGRYELASSKQLSEKANNEVEKLKGNASSLVKNELEGFKSIGSQMKELNDAATKDSKLKGNLDINSYRATAQDPQSAIEQNYTELLANVDVEFMGMPFNVEGFYTTQDANRKAKASYLRFHYDIETAKSKLQKNINSYKSKLGETVSKGQGLESVYRNYAKSLDAQKESLLKNLAKEYDLDPTVLRDAKGDVDQLTSQIPNSLDTGKLLNAAHNNSPELGKKTQTAQAKKDKILKSKKDIEERYQKIVALEQKINKYHALLEKYKNQNHLDSAINYKKMAGLEDKNPTYKDMAKAASGILPEGKAKKFMTGLTNFDMGIINKYESDYTMAGQTMKGLSMGYDLGMVKTGVSVGSTEYVTREGNVDHYSSMLLRVDNKGTKNHKIGFLYNINTPSRAMSIDNNFIGKESVRYPSFYTPSQIVSVVYEGKIKKDLLINSELATFFKNRDGSQLDMAHAALNNSIDYTIPKTGVGFKAAWEHLGNQFENNALPYIRSGTDRYTLGTHFDLFQSFLSVQLDYNYLVQQSFASTGYNTKWGFEIKTHSKRYPSISLSYKPFSTFRTFADTFNIPQRPVQGEVWIARSSYQIKRYKNVHRFTMMYNKNTSTSDSFSYSSSIAQLGYIYTCPSLSVSTSFSRIELPNNFADGTGIISSYISSLSVNKTFFKLLSVSLSPDMSNCTWGLQRISGTLGLVYRMKNKPLLFRTMFRYSKYRLNETAEAQELYAGQLGMNWQFKAVKKKKVVIN